MKDKKGDDAFKEKVARYGTAIVNHLSILVKLTGIHGSINEAMVNAASRLLSDLAPFLDERGELSLKMVEGSFFVEDVRVKTSLSDIGNVEFLAGEFQKRKIGVLTFRAPLQSDDLIYLAYSVKGGVEASEIQSLLESKLTKGISIGGPLFFEKKDSVDMSDTRAVATKLYTMGLYAVKEIDSSSRAGKPINIRKVKRVIHAIVDNILKDENVILGFTTLKNFENYQYNHMINTAILSIAIGKRIKLPKNQLSSLGMAAVFHDIGKTEIPLSILNKPSGFNPKELELIMRHPVEGVKALVRAKDLSDISIISMLVSFEHHLNYDNTGYPEFSRKRTPNIFSRIIGIADYYDALTSGKIYGRVAYTPENALKSIYEKSGKAFDPILTKVFINMLAGNSPGSQ
ncbi:MAG: HD domain-containing protein [Thermodesulfovibrionales bacterium]|nr:HD domain-containing protein [Thermodesulfovibrionales bacterium]